MHSITQTIAVENEISSITESFFSAFKLGSLLKQRVVDRLVDFRIIEIGHFFEHGVQRTSRAASMTALPLRVRTAASVSRRRPRTAM